MAVTFHGPILPVWYSWSVTTQRQVPQISSVHSDLFPLSQLVHLCLFIMHALLSSKKDPRRLRSCNNEAVCAVHLAINHQLPYDKSSVALNCYVNLFLVSAFAGQMLLTGIENNQATSEAEWGKYTCVVVHWLKKLGTGAGEEETQEPWSVTCHRHPDDLRKRKDLFYSKSR